jgi:hypothetical protein
MLRKEAFLINKSEFKSMSDDPLSSSPSSLSNKEKESVLNQSLTQDLSIDELWDHIGFHKPLAGFWFGLSFKILSLILSIIISGVLINYFYPFPESIGYRSAATGIFSLFFSIMDLGTNMTMDRFIAEARITNPRKMIQYVQYFIWYQMTTGLIQTTSVSLYAIYIVPRTELSYAVWLMLICSTTQFPGWLGVFRGTLGALQQYNKTEVLGFITGEVFQRITELLFVYLGRLYGAANPQFGEIMGIAIGSMIGLYVDDFFATAVSAYYFTKTMKKEGLTARDCFRIEFDRKLVKECLFFGIKTGMPGLIGLVASLIILWECLLYIPQYTTFSTLSDLASGIAGFINTAAGCPTSLFSEAYLNGKKKLTQYYIAQTIRYATLFQGFFLATIIAISFILQRFFTFFNMINYLYAIPFLIPWVIRHFQQPYTSLADNILLGTNHPTFLMGIRFLEELLKLLFMTLWIVWLRLPAIYGVNALIWILPCGIYIPIMVKTISSYVFIQRNIVKIHLALWQTLVVPIICGSVIFLFDFVLIQYIFDLLEPLIGFPMTIGVGIFLFFFFLITIYIPLTTYLGGWDNNSLREFKNAAKMSGPSKFMVIPMYKLAEKAAKKSPFHNKHELPYLDAVKEARELLALKNSHQIQD